MAVGKREVFLVVSKKHAFFSREEEIELQDLKRERIILSGEGTAIRHAVSRVFKKYNFRPEAYVESDSLDFIKAMLAENQAMAFLPYPPVRAEVKKGVFKTLRLSCGRIYLDLRVFFSRRDFLSPPAKRFVQIIKEGLM
jgi:DNA-binding transcriptional LysR family regulator